MASIRFVVLMVLAFASCRKQQESVIAAGSTQGDAGVAPAPPPDLMRPGLAIDVTHTELGQWAREIKAQTGPAYFVTGHLFCTVSDAEKGTAVCQVEIGGTVRNFSNATGLVQALKSDSNEFSVAGEFSIKSVSSETGGPGGSNSATLKTHEFGEWQAILRSIETSQRVAAENANQAFQQKLQSYTPRFRELVAAPLVLTSDQQIKVVGMPECVLQVTGLLPKKTVHLWLRQSIRFGGDFKSACVAGEPCPELSCPAGLEETVKQAIAQNKRMDFRMLDTPVGLKAFQKFYQSSNQSDEHLMGMLFIDGQEIGAPK